MAPRVFKVEFDRQLSNGDFELVTYAVKVQSDSFEEFKREILARNPGFGENIRMSYEDLDYDEITLANAADYELFKESGSNRVFVQVIEPETVEPLKKVETSQLRYIAKAQKPSVSHDHRARTGSYIVRVRTDEEPSIHPNVYCDECKRDIVDFRYKCLDCNNYDLCIECEHGMVHSHHRFLRIPDSRKYDFSRLDAIRAVIGRAKFTESGSGKMDERDVHHQDGRKSDKEFGREKFTESSSGKMFERRVHHQDGRKSDIDLAREQFAESSSGKMFNRRVHHQDGQKLDKEIAREKYDEYLANTYGKMVGHDDGRKSDKHMSKPMFEKEEEVFWFHGAFLRKAKIVQVRTTIREDGQYKHDYVVRCSDGVINSTSFNELVSEDQLLKYNLMNLKKYSESCDKRWKLAFEEARKGDVFNTGFITFPEPSKFRYTDKPSPKPATRSQVSMKLCNGSSLASAYYPSNYPVYAHPPFFTIKAREPEKTGRQVVEPNPPHVPSLKSNDRRQSENHLAKMAITLEDQLKKFIDGKQTEIINKSNGSTSDKRDVKLDVLTDASAMDERAKRDGLPSASDKRDAKREDLPSASDKRDANREDLPSASDKRDAKREDLPSASDKRDVKRDDVPSASDKREAKIDELTDASAMDKRAKRDGLPSASDKRDAKRDDVPSASEKRDANREDLPSASDKRDAKRDDLTDDSSDSDSSSESDTEESEDESFNEKSNQVRQLKETISALETTTQDLKREVAELKASKAQSPKTRTTGRHNSSSKDWTQLHANGSEGNADQAVAKEIVVIESDRQAKPIESGKPKDAGAEAQKLLELAAKNFPNGLELEWLKKQIETLKL